MGWLFGWHTRRDLIDHLVSGNGVRTLAHCFRGNDMWAVQEIHREGQAPLRFICLYMLRGRSGSRDGWGYKYVTEDPGTYRTNCPVKYLGMVPDPGGYATEWRARVREEAARKAQRLRVGDWFRYRGKEFMVIDTLGRRGYLIEAQNGCRDRLPLARMGSVTKLEERV